MPAKSGKTKQQIARGKRIRGYGITEIEYETLEAQQNYACAICGKDNEGKPLHIDHDHETNLVRGLLCLKCNRGIGLLNDNADNCFKAYEYLTNGTPWWLKGKLITRYGQKKRVPLDYKEPEHNPKAVFEELVAILKADRNACG